MKKGVQNNRLGWIQALVQCILFVLIPLPFYFYLKYYIELLYTSFVVLCHIWWLVLRFWLFLAFDVILMHRLSLPFFHILLWTFHIFLLLMCPIIELFYYFSTINSKEKYNFLN